MKEVDDIEADKFPPGCTLGDNLALSSPLVDADCATTGVAVAASLDDWKASLEETRTAAVSSLLGWPSLSVEESSLRHLFSSSDSVEHSSEGDDDSDGDDDDSV